MGSGERAPDGKNVVMNEKTVTNAVVGTNTEIEAR
jgi:hypothetical protein